MTTRQISTEEFVRRAVLRHGSTYDYSKSKYQGAGSKVLIVCTVHGEFLQQASNHLAGCGCPKCSVMAISDTTETFIAKAKEVHGDYFDYSAVKYLNSKEKVTIGCPHHGAFKQAPSAHLQGNTCRKCIDESKALTTEQFVQRSRAIHGDVYDYSLTEYLQQGKHVTIICPRHGEFSQKAQSHLDGRGCLKCKPRKYSKSSLYWLQLVSEFRGIHIQHAENGGEYQIPGTRFSVDGYCAETNTVFEFHGSAYHGDPKVFSARTRCNPYNRNVTAASLYKKTLKREQEIRNLGYNLEVMWESDFLAKLRRLSLALPSKI